jgi:hypothetical protein
VKPLQHPAKLPTPSAAAAMPFTVFSHDSWGSTSVGSFASLQEAQALFEALRNDRWFNDDGTIRAISIVDSSAGSPRTVASHSFQGAS